jgi:antitoxin component YwqK of YwqJK toxin-antitoxin module
MFKLGLKRELAFVMGVMLLMSISLASAEDNKTKVLTESEQNAIIQKLLKERPDLQGALDATRGVQESFQSSGVNPAVSNNGKETITTYNDAAANGKRLDVVKASNGNLNRTIFLDNGQSLTTEYKDGVVLSETYIDNKKYTGISIEYIAPDSIKITLTDYKTGVYVVIIHNPLTGEDISVSSGRRPGLTDDSKWCTVTGKFEQEKTVNVNALENRNNNPPGASKPGTNPLGKSK